MLGSKASADSAVPELRIMGTLEDGSRGAFGKDLLISGTPSTGWSEDGDLLEAGALLSKSDSTKAKVCLCTNSVDETDSTKVP